MDPMGYVINTLRLVSGFVEDRTVFFIDTSMQFDLAESHARRCHLDHIVPSYHVNVHIYFMYKCKKYTLYVRVYIVR